MERITLASDAFSEHHTLARDRIQVYGSKAVGVEVFPSVFRRADDCVEASGRGASKLKVRLQSASLA